VGTFAGRAVRKILRDVKSPRDAAVLCWRAMVPPDPRLREIRSRIWGNLPRVALREAFPGIETVDIQILEPYRRQLASTLDLEELSALLAIVRYTNSKNILEIGTYDGSTTLNLAANLPEDARVVTVDLPPQSAADQTAITVPTEHRNKTKHVIGERFLQSPHRSKIRQVFGDSAALDWTSLGLFDIVFIDGCHFQEYVLSDTRNAFAVLRPGGLVVWHDYGQNRHVTEVVDGMRSPGSKPSSQNGRNGSALPSGNGRTYVAISGTRLALAASARP